MTEHYVVAVVGRPGTGTAALAERLTDYLDVDHRDVTDYIRATTGQESLGADGDIDANIAVIGLYKAMRENHSTQFVDYCLDGLENSPHQGRVITGLNNRYDIGDLAVKVRCFTIGLELPPAQAWEQYRTQYGSDASDLGKFLILSDYAGNSDDPNGWHIDEIISQSAEPIGTALNAQNPTSHLFWQSVRALQAHSLLA